MKILLIIPRYNITNQINYNYTFPLGLAYISAVIKRAGYSIDCFNLNHKKGKIEELICTRLNSQKYDLVLTGGIAIVYNSIERIINTVKNHLSHPKIILGGSIITSEPELIFNALHPDFGVVGEGEETIIELLSALEKQKDINFENIPGLIYTKEGKTIITKTKGSPENLDSLPSPDFNGLEFNEQLNHLYCNSSFVNNKFDFPRVYPLIGSRGCPFQCTFCYHYNKYRSRSIKNILTELAENVIKYNINIIMLYDECFAVDTARIREFCEGIKKLSSSISKKLSWICQMRVDKIDIELLRIMKDAGCNCISYGFESFSPKVLQSMKKGITPIQIEKAFYATLNAGIAIQANFIFGDIKETIETSNETINWWKQNARGSINLDYIRPYPNSKIYQHCVRKGLIKDKLNFIKNIDSASLLMNMTDNMTDIEDKHLKQRTLIDLRRKYCSWVVPISIKKEASNAFAITVRCPHCKKVITYRNCFLNNSFIYQTNVICRECPMRFFIVSPIIKIYKKYFEKWFRLSGKWGILKRKINKFWILHG